MHISNYFFLFFPSSNFIIFSLSRLVRQIKQWFSCGTGRGYGGRFFFQFKKRNRNFNFANIQTDVQLTSRLLSSIDSYQRQSLSGPSIADDHERRNSGIACSRISISCFREKSSRTENCRWQKKNGGRLCAASKQCFSVENVPPDLKMFLVS